MIAISGKEVGEGFNRIHRCPVQQVLYVISIGERQEESDRTYFELEGDVWR